RTELDSVKMNLRLFGATLILVTIAACKSPKHERREVVPPSTAIKPTAQTRATPIPTGPDLAPPSTGAPIDKPAVKTAAPIAAVAGDVCKITRGPVQLPFTGQVTLWIDDNALEPRFVFNRNGVAHAVTLPSAPKDAKKSGKDVVKSAERLALSEP